MTAAESNRAWYRPSVDLSVAGLLVIELLLWLCDRFKWFPKGYPALFAVATIAGAILLIVLRFFAALPIHRPFQFGIRSMLLFVVAVAVLCSWLTIELKKAREQKAADENLVFVSYDWQLDASGRTINDARPPAPEWLRNLLGEDFFADIVSLYLYKTNVTDANMGYLKGMPELKDLELSDTLVTDAGLENLRGLTRLKGLGMNNTRVTDAGLVPAEGLRQLRWVSLAGTRVTDAGLAHLRELKQLEALNLSYTRITDSGLEYLKGLPRLDVLYLAGAEVTEGGIAKFQKDLPNCRISR